MLNASLQHCRLYQTVRCEISSSISRESYIVRYSCLSACARLDNEIELGFAHCNSMASTRTMRQLVAVSGLLRSSVDAPRLEPAFRHDVLHADL